MARRINKKLITFLVGLTIAVALVGAGGLLLAHHLHSGDPHRFMVQGDEAMRANEPEKALAFYSEALHDQPDNTDALLGIGDAYERIAATTQDRQDITRALRAWNQAVSLDPQCVAGLNKLLNFFSQAASERPVDANFGYVKTFCNKLLAVRPNDLKAQEQKQLTIIRQWLATGVNSSDELSQAITRWMPELIKRDPGNPELVETLATAMVRQARDLLDQQDLTSARARLRKATALIDEVAKARKDDGAMQLACYHAYLQARAADPDAKADAMGRSGTAQTAYNQRIQSCLDTAFADSAKLDPSKQLFVDIRLAIADWAGAQGKPAEQEKLIRDFTKDHPDNQTARLQLARLLLRRGNDKSRDEAIGLLSKPISTPPSLDAFQANHNLMEKAATIEELTRARISEYETQPTNRKKLGEQIDDGIESLRRLAWGRRPFLEGLFHMAKGETVEAVKSFEQAAGPVTTGPADAQAVFALAQAYRVTGQPGLARQRAQQFLHMEPSNVQGRVALGEILLADRDIAGAKAQYAALKEEAPDDASVKSLGSDIILNDRSGNLDERRDVLEQKPEATRAQRMGKAQAAVAMGLASDAVRLYEEVLKDSPGDAQASAALAGVYLTVLGQKESAKRVIADALKTHPEDADLVMVNAQLNDLLPAETYELTRRAVEHTADPFTREMQMFRLESAPGGHPEQAFAHLLAASKLKPDDPSTMDLLFRHYLAHRDFDSAAAMLDSLSSRNVDECGGLMFRWRLAWAKNDLPAAADVCEQLIHQYPSFAATWLVSAQTSAARGRFDEARSRFQEALNRKPTDQLAIQGVVDCDYRLNDIDDAQTLLHDAWQKFPTEVRFREEYLDNLVNSGKSIQAVPIREQILSQDVAAQKDVADDYLSLAKAYFHAAQDVAVTRPSDAHDLLNKSFQTLAAGKAKFPDEPRFYGQLAEMYQYNRDLVSGEKVLLEFYNRPEFKNKAEPAVLLSDFYARANHLDVSERYLNEALVKANNSDDPSSLPLRLRLAALLTQEKKFHDAYAVLDGVAPSERNNPAIVRQRFETLISEGRRDEAAEGIKAALAAGESIDLRNLYASLLLDDHKTKEARQQLDRVLAMNPSNEIGIYLDALATAQSGDPDAAISKLLALRNHNPHNPRVRLLLAELYLKKGKTESATRELVDGLEKEPLDRDLRLALIRLYRQQRPMTDEIWAKVLKLTTDAEADPVLGSDPTWAREEALVYADREPPQPARVVLAWHKVTTLAPDNFQYRRELVDLLLRFKDYTAADLETQRLLEEGRSDWWLHYQRALVLVHSDKSKAPAEFDKALAATDAAKEPAQAELIIRGLGANIGYNAALKALTPLLSPDPDGRWRLLEVSLLRAKDDYPGAIKALGKLLADPVMAASNVRYAALRAQADIYQSAPAALKLSPADATKDYLKSRDAYVAMLKVHPEDLIALNNLAYLLSEKIPPPEGGPQKAKEYSARAYGLIQYAAEPDVMVLDTHGWILTQCGGDDAREGLRILQKMMVEREDTRDFIEGRYHLAEALLRAPKPDLAEAQKWLQQAMDLVGAQERAGHSVDPAVKDEVQTALAQVTGHKASAG